MGDGTSAARIDMTSAQDTSLNLVATAGSAAVEVKAGVGHQAKFSLISAGYAGATSKAFHMLSHATNKFSISSTTAEILSINGTTGKVGVSGDLEVGKDVTVQGNLLIGGPQTNGSKHLHLTSQQDASMTISSLTSSSTLKLSSGTGADSSLVLGDYSLTSSGVSDGLKLSDSSSRTLMDLSANGTTFSTGELTVAGAGSTTLSILSSNSLPSLFNVSAEGGDAGIMLQTNNGRKFSITNSETSQKLVVKSDQLEVMTLNSTNVAINGSVSISGALSVSKNMQIDGTLHVGGTLTRSCGGSDKSARWDDNNHCYKLVKEKGTFQAAQRKCESWGGYLASVKSVQENDFIKSAIIPQASGDFYLGYTDGVEQGNHLWVSGEIAVLNNTHLYNNWENQEMLDTKGERNCAVMYTSKEDYGVSYNGTVSTTVSGRSCRDWNSDTPHGYVFNPSQFPDTLIGEHNHCRNPDNRVAGAFCVTNDPNVQTEHCDVTGYWRDASCNQQKEFLCERNF